MAVSPEELLGDWYTRLRFGQYAHYETAKFFDRLNYWLGIPVIILSTLVGTSIFASLGESIVVGLVSILSAMLAGIQTFLKFSEKAERHRITAAKYGALRRQIEEIITVHEEITQEIVSALRQEIDRIAEESPHIPERIWSRRQEVLKQDRASSLGLLNRE